MFMRRPRVTAHPTTASPRCRSTRYGSVAGLKSRLPGRLRRPAAGRPTAPTATTPASSGASPSGESSDGSDLGRRCPSGAPCPRSVTSRGWSTTPMPELDGRLAIKVSREQLSSRRFGTHEIPGTSVYVSGHQGRSEIGLLAGHAAAQSTGSSPATKRRPCTGVTRSSPRATCARQARSSRRCLKRRPLRLHSVTIPATIR
jgi:hypothetical protein